MRDKVSTQCFLKELETSMVRITNKETVFRKNHVVIDPNFLLNNEIFVNSKSLLDLIALGVALWYLDPLLRYEILLILEEKSKRFCLEDRFLLSQVLSTKAEMQLFLLETKLFHSREFWGNIVARVPRVLRSIRISRKKTKVKFVQRKRGYDDHGSCVPVHRWLPKHDWSLTELQNKKEDDLDTMNDTLNFLTGYLS